MPCFDGWLTGDEEKWGKCAHFGMLTIYDTYMMEKLDALITA
jgi:hypothetical protein